MTSQEVNGFDLMLSGVLSQTDEPDKDTEQVNSTEKETPSGPSNKRQKTAHDSPPESPSNGTGNHDKSPPEVTGGGETAHDKSATTTEPRFDKVDGHFYNRQGVLRIKLSKTGYDYVAVLSLKEALEANKTMVCQYLRNLNTKGRNNLIRKYPAALDCFKTE